MQFVPRHYFWQWITDIARGTGGLYLHWFFLATVQQWRTVTGHLPLGLLQPRHLPPRISHPVISHPDFSHPEFSHTDFSDPDFSHNDFSHPDFSHPYLFLDCENVGSVLWTRDHLSVSISLFWSWINIQMWASVVHCNLHTYDFGCNFPKMVREGWGWV